MLFCYIIVEYLNSIWDMWSVFWLHQNPKIYILLDLLFGVRGGRPAYPRLNSIIELYNKKFKHLFEFF